MFNSIKRDLKRRNLYKKYEKKRLLYKALIHDANIDPAVKVHYIQALNQLPRNSSKVRLKNRCVLSGRSHSVYKFCRLSRIKFRDLANKGQIAGCVKASW
jgi:ribosomal protein S14